MIHFLPLTYSLTHLLTYSLTHLLTYSLTHLLTYSLTHLLPCSQQASLNGVVLLQALSNGMGDLWQVMAIGLGVGGRLIYGS